MHALSASRCFCDSFTMEYWVKVRWVVTTAMGVSMGIEFGGLITVGSSEALHVGIDQTEVTIDQTEVTEYGCYDQSAIGSLTRHSFSTFDFSAC